MSELPYPVHAPGRKTILLVEDERAVREMLAHTLREHGYTVIEAADGFAGVQAAAQCEEGIDLLITDLVMPRMSGRDLAVHLNRMFPEAGILLMSGYAEDAVASAGPLHETAFLAKPASLAKVLRCVRELLDRHVRAPQARDTAQSRSSGPG